MAEFKHARSYDEWTKLLELLKGDEYKLNLEIYERQKEWKELKENNYDLYTEEIEKWSENINNTYNCYDCPRYQWKKGKNCSMQCLTEEKLIIIKEIRDFK